MSDDDAYIIITGEFNDNIKIEFDNIEVCPQYFPDNKIVIRASSSNLRKKLSYKQLNFIGKTFFHSILSNQNKMTIISFIESNIKPIIMIKDEYSQNMNAIPFLLSILSILNNLIIKSEVYSKSVKGRTLTIEEKNKFLEEKLGWNTELSLKIVHICESCWVLRAIQVRIICSLIYAKLILLKPNDYPLTEFAESMLKYRLDNQKMPTIIGTLGFIHKYNDLEYLKPIQNQLSNI